MGRPSKLVATLVVCILTIKLVALALLGFTAALPVVLAAGSVCVVLIKLSCDWHSSHQTSAQRSRPFAMFALHSGMAVMAFNDALLRPVSQCSWTSIEDCVVFWYPAVSCCLAVIIAVAVITERLEPWSSLRLAIGCGALLALVASCMMHLYLPGATHFPPGETSFSASVAATTTAILTVTLTRPRWRHGYVARLHGFGSAVVGNNVPRALVELPSAGAVSEQASGDSVEEALVEVPSAHTRVERMMSMNRACACAILERRFISQSELTPTSSSVPPSPPGTPREEGLMAEQLFIAHQMASLNMSSVFTANATTDESSRRSHPSRPLVVHRAVRRGEDHPGDPTRLLISHQEAAVQAITIRETTVQASSRATSRPPPPTSARPHRLPSASEATRIDTDGTASPASPSGYAADTEKGSSSYDSTMASFSVEMALCTSWDKE